MNLLYCELLSTKSWNTQIESNPTVLYSTLRFRFTEELNYIFPQWKYYLLCHDPLKIIAFFELIMCDLWRWVWNKDRGGSNKGNFLLQQY